MVYPAATAVPVRSRSFARRWRQLVFTLNTRNAEGGWGAPPSDDLAQRALVPAYLLFAPDFFAPDFLAVDFFALVAAPFLAAVDLFADFLAVDFFATGMIHLLP
jgi:hypothetical protein